MTMSDEEFGRRVREFAEAMKEVWSPAAHRQHQADTIEPTSLADLRRQTIAQLQGGRKPGKVYSAGQTIPDTVDLVMVGNGQRWHRLLDPDGNVVPFKWLPRGGHLPDVVSENEMLDRFGHVTEIPRVDGDG